MKKKLLIGILAFAMVCNVTACGKSKTKETNDQSQEQVTDETVEEVPEEEMTILDYLQKMDIDEYITLGEYKGVTVEKVTTAVTEEAIDTEIQAALSDFPVEMAGRAAQDGDTVNIDFVGRIDGNEFEGGTGQNTDLKLGSHQFIDGFEEGLIGATAGETRVLNLTFPADFNEELGGKAAEFTVTVNVVKVPLEEPTDEWVAANIEGYNTVEEFRENIRANQEIANEETSEDQFMYNAWGKVVDSTEIHEYPEEIVEAGKEEYRSEIEQMAAYKLMTVDEYISSVGETQESYEKYAEEYGKDIAGQIMIAYAIFEKEGFEVGDETYQATEKELADEYSMTPDEIIETYGRNLVEQNVIQKIVMKVIVDNAIVAGDTADSVQS